METIKTRKQVKEEVANHNTVARSVNRFTKVMKLKLMMNLHKEHWSKCPRVHIGNSFLESITKLRLSVSKSATPEEVAKCAADVANYAMMIAENYKTDYLKQQREKGESNEN